MSPSMPYQLVAIPKGLLTELTGVSLVVALVDPQVLCEVFPLYEAFLTDVALVWSQGSVHASVLGRLRPLDHDVGGHGAGRLCLDKARRRRSGGGQ